MTSHIYLARNGGPERNIAKVIEMIGGIEKIAGNDDIVIIKPNSQWGGHAGTNTDCLKGFIDLLLSNSRFEGEIIIADNHHDDPDNGRGWTTSNRNGKFNLNELVKHYQERGYLNVTKYHWRDGGPNPWPLQFKAGNGGIVSDPEEGDGYVWSDEEYNYRGRKVKMSYPIFTSTFSGITIDFKSGAWKEGKYIERPVKFINFASLYVHPGRYAGATACVKNYLGVVDLTCGEHGVAPPDYYNFHYISIGFPRDNFLGNVLERIIRLKPIRRRIFLTKLIRKLCPVSGAMGGTIGYFMKTIRMADLNIITAEHIGHRGRWEKPAHTRAVLASKDPVALDYYAVKYLLLPLVENPKRIDPDNPKSPFRRYLQMCHEQGIGTLNEEEMVVHEFGFHKSDIGVVVRKAGEQAKARVTKPVSVTSVGSISKDTNNLAQIRNGSCCLYRNPFYRRGVKYEL
jgi:hypothetical protein